MTLRTGKLKRTKGFALIEALLAIVILAFGITACLGSLSMCLKVKDKIEKRKLEVSRLEPLFFEMESGQRDDLKPLTLDALDPDFKSLKELHA